MNDQMRAFLATDPSILDLACRIYCERLRVGGEPCPVESVDMAAALVQAAKSRPVDGATVAVDNMGYFYAEKESFDRIGTGRTAQEAVADLFGHAPVSNVVPLRGDKE